MFNRINQDKPDLIWIEKPALNHPYLILGFEGWPDAGKVASGVISYISSKLSTTLFAKMSPDKFYLNQNGINENQRPQTVVEKGIVKNIEIPTTNFGYAKDPSSNHDLILVYGPEPVKSWEKYSHLIMKVAKKYNAEKIIAVGGTFDAIPHTVATRITASISSPEILNEIQSKGIELVDYKGPASIHTLLIMYAAQEKIPMINLWGHTPHYIQIPNSMGCFELLTKICSFLDFKIDLGEAQKAGELLYAQIDQAMEIKPELKKYLNLLEIGYKKEKANFHQPINKNIVKEIEKLLNDKLT